ncbi:MAG: sensor domain-containing diguanylate cyclase [Acidobacteria bacterium]|nr:sensor domain-containing diguanylate cyclase [Acidobacteriota bacterium]
MVVMPDPQTTESKQAPSSLEFFKNCPDYAIIFDTQWRILYANPSFEARFCPETKAEGRSLLDILDEVSVIRIKDLQDFLLQGSRHTELHHLTPDGKITTLNYTFFPLSEKIFGQQLIGGIARERSADLASLLEIINLNLELERKQKELSDANTRLEQVAATDQMTGLYNRYYFFQVAQRIWEEYRRYKKPATLMMLDLDNFKEVNDTFGHLLGDYVLKETAARLKSRTRRVDILARYGGEEFVLLAPNTDTETGLVLAERLRTAVSDGAYTQGRHRTLASISIGVSSTELQDFPSFQDMLESSDQALYSAKRSGKNCVYEYSRGMIPRSN